jgi:hypothetical protein
MADGDSDGGSTTIEGSSTLHRRPRARLILAGVAVVALAVVGGRVLAFGGDDDDDAAGPQRATTTVATTTTRATTTEASTTTTAFATTTTTAPTFVPVAAAGGAFQVSLPSDWGSTDVGGDMSGRGAEMFPHNVAHAGLVNDVLETLVTPEMSFMAMEGSGVADLLHADVLLVESAPANVGLEAAYATMKESRPVEVLAEGRSSTGVGESAWYEFEAPGVAGLRGREYVLVHHGKAWMVTYWSADMPTRGTIADQILASFTPA